jgi:crotonobetainyl-CoA:carnitine CoA-transferase CaiB-like acyl-CoA transferase
VTSDPPSTAAAHAAAAAKPDSPPRIVTIAQNVPGPLAVGRWVALGAAATKIEPPAGDPFIPICRSWYDELHQGVVIERLDLKSTEGRARLGDLLRDADLFVTSQRPAALARLALDPAGVHRDAPRVRILRIVGSLADPEQPGHDLTYQASAGLLRNALPPTLSADVIASERAFSGMLMLLRQPAGSVLDVGLEDSLAPLTAPIRHGLTASGGLLGGGLPEYGVYRSKDGWLAVAALEHHFRDRFFERLGLPVGSDPSPLLCERTGSEWEAWAREHDLPIVAVPKSV